MRNAGWKRLLAVVLVLMMTLSLMPAAFADGDVECTMGEGCPATVHNEGCPAAPKVEVEEVVVTCTGAEGCPATVHNAGCPAAPKVEVEEVVVTCTGAEGCPAAVHNEGCPAAPKVEVKEVKTCTGAADCTATVHNEGCLAVKKTEVEEVVVTCTGAADCTAETHEEGCLSLKKGEPEPEVPAAVQAFLDAVAAIVIPENPEEMDEDSRAALEAQIEVAYDALEALSDEELQREDVLAACAIMSAAMDILYGEREQYAQTIKVNVEVRIWNGNVLSGGIVSSTSGSFSNPTSANQPVSSLTTNSTASGGITVSQFQWTNSSASKFVATATASGSSSNKWGIYLPDPSQLYSNLQYTEYKYVSSYPGSYSSGSAIANPYKPTSAPTGCTIYLLVKAPAATTTKNYTITKVFEGITDSNLIPSGYTLNYNIANDGGNGTLTVNNATKTAVDGDVALKWTVNATVPTDTSKQTNVTFTESGYAIDGYECTPFGSSGTMSVQIQGGSSAATQNLTNTYTEKSKPTPPPAPDAPNEDELKTQLPNAVKIECVNADMSHEDKTYGLIDGSFTVDNVEENDAGGYTCTVTIQAAEYVTQYNTDTGVTHELDPANQTSKTVTLAYDEDTSWTPEDGAVPVTFTVKCVTPPAPTGEPAAPDGGKLAELLGQVVAVECVNNKATHEKERTYGLLAGSYDIGEVTGDETNGYTCTITIQAAKYVEAYNTDTGVTHELDPANQTSKTVTLAYDEDTSWTPEDGAVPVTFTVKCVTPPSPTGTPDAPDAGKLAEELENVILVQCVNNKATHEKERTYGLLAGSYVIGMVTGDDTSGYFCTITVSATPYVEAYNSGVASGHSLADDQLESGNIDLKYSDTNSAWELASHDGPPVVFRVKCEGEEILPPPAPSQEKLAELLGETAVTIDCVNTGDSHADKTYVLLGGSFTGGDVEGNETDGYTYTVTIQAGPYVEAYNSDVAAGHSLATGETPSKTVTLEYDADNEEWTVPANAVPVVFQVVCGASQPATDWSKLTITKTVSPTGTVMPGDTVTYTITVTNNTEKLLSNITVSETLDRTKLESFVASADKDYNFTSGTWRIWALANGSSTTLTISAKVKADATGTINNTATITGAVSGEEELTLNPRPSSSVSITVGTPAPMNTFTLRYNANGGKGAPSSQSVETTAKIVVMTVSSVKPTRDGYYFCGWALTPNGHVSYRPGNEITLTGDVTLYAVWATPTSSPQTGDSSNVALWAAMAGMSLAAGAVVLFVLKKRKAE